MHFSSEAVALWGLQPATLALARPTRSISTIYSTLLHMRLNPNPLPVTKAKGHHCHQIPATFLRCCVQQWDEVYPHLSSTPTDHAAFAPNLSHSKENCTIHCFLQGKLLHSFYNLEGNEICKTQEQRESYSKSDKLLLETIHSQEMRRMINVWIFSLKKRNVEESLVKRTGILCTLSEGVLWVC